MDLSPGRRARDVRASKVLPDRWGTEPCRFIHLVLQMAIVLVAASPLPSSVVSENATFAVCATAEASFAASYLTTREMLLSTTFRDSSVVEPASGLSMFQPDRAPVKLLPRTCDEQARAPAFFVEHLSGIDSHMRLSGEAATADAELLRATIASRQAQRACSPHDAYLQDLRSLALIPYWDGGRGGATHNLAGPSTRVQRLRATMCSVSRHFSALAVGVCADLARTAAGTVRSISLQDRLVPMLVEAR